MTHISRSALVQHTPTQMYNLVDDIKAYPQFLPWCSAATEHTRDAESVKASITIAKGALNKTFTTLNKVQAPHKIELSLVDGPFQQLHGLWRFEPLGETACKVSLALEFEFSNKLLSLAIGPIFNQIANSMVDSFVQRAKSVYG